MEKPTKKKKNVHANHRQRMIGKLMQNGLDIFADHEVIELLLFWMIPRINTNPIAHELLDTFGSIHAVMDATPQQLQQVYKIGERSAQSFYFLREFFRYYEQDRERQATESLSLRSTQEICDYSRVALADETAEVLFVLYLNNASCVVHEEKINPKATGYTPLIMRRIIEPAFFYNAVSLVIIHYYPCHFPTSFRQDVLVKNSLQHILVYLSITLLDMLILSPEHSSSLFEL